MLKSGAEEWSFPKSEVGRCRVVFQSTAKPTLESTSADKKKKRCISENCLGHSGAVCVLCVCVWLCESVCV